MLEQAERKSGQYQALDQIASTVAGGVAKQHKAEQDAAYQKQLEAHEAAEEHRQGVIKNLTEAQLQRLSPQMANMTANEKAAFIQEDEQMQELFSRYSADETENKRFQQEFITSRLTDWTKEDTENVQSREFNRVASTAVEGTLSLVDADKEPDAVTEDIYQNIKKAPKFGKKKEDVAGVYVSYIKSALQGGTEEEKLGAIELYQRMQPIQSQLGEQAEDFRNLGVKIRKTNETLQQAHFEKQSRFAQANIDAAIKSGDVGQVEKLVEHYSAADMFSEKQIRGFYSRATTNAREVQKQQTLVQDTLNAKKLADNTDVSKSDLKQADKVLAGSLFVTDENGAPTISDTNLVNLVDGMAVNPDVSYKRVTDKLFGGLDFAAETDKEGNPSPRLVKSVQYAQRIGDMKGVTFLKERMGSRRYNQFALLRAATNDEYDNPQTFKEGQELVKRATAYQEKNGKPNITETVKSDLVDALEDSGDIEQETAQAFIEQNEQQAQLFLSAFQGDGERAGQMLGSLVGDDVAEYQDKEIMNGAAVFDTLKQNVHYKSEEVVDSILEPLAVEAGLDIDDLEITVNPDNKAEWRINAEDGSLGIFGKTVNMLEEAEKLDSDVYMTASEKSEQEKDEAEAKAAAARQKANEEAERRLEGQAMAASMAAWDESRGKPKGGNKAASQASFFKDFDL
ncbi:hypothetical protein [Salinivibrio kushneri]|uniref:hypothetical protein n=1 Tax=Salinivibrio kushneri TaxID=1908198 RepID=UPI0010542310|nr:hypothetical protein [Salinivibrio kushneri]